MDMGLYSYKRQRGRYERVNLNVDYGELRNYHINTRRFRQPIKDTKM